MSDIPVVIFIVCVILFLLYLSYICFSLAREHTGFRRFVAVYGLVICMTVVIFLVYGLLTQHPDVSVYHPES